MAAPERFAESQIPLALRAPSIHGPSRHIALPHELGRYRGIVLQNSKIPL